MESYIALTYSYHPFLGKIESKEYLRKDVIEYNGFCLKNREVDINEI